ncbi:MAG: gliding motility-associated ABC transporter ATP-binding subunit GldA, partial [Odoribacter sp.]|nr:gliding motility-associated ABC transporter ATP-binding subunit GldA [Odoribacter sp.]
CKIFANGKSAELLRKSTTDKLINVHIIGAPHPDIYNALAELPEIENILPAENQHFNIQCNRETNIEKTIFDLCCQNNWYIGEMAPVETRLEDIFRQVTQN